MHHILTTGELARLLDTTEPRLGELVRRGRISPPPAVVAGRRQWTSDQARQAAAALGFFPLVVEDLLSRAASREEEVQR